MYVIIVRRSMLNELFGAHIFGKYYDAYIIATDSIVTPTPEIIGLIEYDDDVMVVGGYYRGHLDKIVADAGTVTVIYNSSDVPEDGIDFKISHNGFASYAVSKMDCTADEITIATLLDEYSLGLPSTASLNFQQGIHTLEGLSNQEKLLKIIEKQISIAEVIERGRTRRAESSSIIDDRVSSAKIFVIDGNEVSVSVGNTSIVESCVKLAQRTGIGMLVRYNEEQDRTF